MRKYRFLETALADPDNDDRPDRGDALVRMKQYRARIDGLLTNAILFEYRGDTAWRYLDPQERAQHGCHSAWRADADRESLIGLLFFSDHDWARAYLPEGFDLTSWFGRIPSLHRITPRRHDLQQYVDLGYLTVEHDPYAGARQTAARTAAIVANRRNRT
jgi:hypothetical protein